MQWFQKIKYLKVILIVVAIIIAIISLIVSNFLVRDLQREETGRMEIWAEAERSFNQPGDNTDMGLVLKVLGGNNTIPVIVLDSQGNVQEQNYNNLDVTFEEDDDSLAVIRDMAMDMKKSGHYIRVFMGQNDYMDVCYGESLMLKRLAVYPYVQLSVVIIFVLIALFALFSSMKAEQNKVWVGLSKETAHQLGTPISSLVAWTEVLKDTYPDDSMLTEMEQDVKRLEMIAERFSKIGSIPEPKCVDVCEVVERVISYMDRRTSNKVVITSHCNVGKVEVNMVSSLFEWVLENLCKNAVDAMDGSGRIDVYVSVVGRKVVIDVKDTGKGMPKSHFKSVFKPGFTTKKRGWGLGLSLAKRIVEEYHHGKIFVKSSEIGRGTTFRVEI